MTGWPISPLRCRVWAPGPSACFGSDEQKAWLDRTRTGKAISAFALSEPRSGSDVANMEMTATRDGNHYVLSGEKTWISNGGIADLYCVFARTSEAPGARGISCFLVPADTPGLAVAERLEVIAPHPLARLTFDDCRIPATALIGEPGQGFRIAMSVLDVLSLDRWRGGTRLRAPGAGRKHCPGSRPAASSAHRSSTCRWCRGTSRRWRSTWTRPRCSSTGPPGPRIRAPPRVTREAAMAKLYATDRAQEVIDKAVQLHGGDGVRKGHIVESLYREIRALRIYEGASDVQKVVIARQAMGAAQ